jgi:flagellin-like protein
MDNEKCITKKGISPIIASVLLIAFTVAVAGLVGTWATQFTSSTTSDVEQTAKIQLTCVNGGVALSYLTYSSGYLRGLIENSGRISLGEIKVQVVYQNSTLGNNNLCVYGATAINCTTANISLAPAEIITFNISVASNYDRIRVSTNCSNIYDDAKRSDISS